jgi:hypothetical protein
MVMTPDGPPAELDSNIVLGFIVGFFCSITLFLIFFLILRDVIDQNAINKLTIRMSILSSVVSFPTAIYGPKKFFEAAEFIAGHLFP